MPVPKRKTSKGRRDRRRSHIKKSTTPNLVKCKKCGKLNKPHTICKSCGSY